MLAENVAVLVDDQHEIDGAAEGNVAENRVEIHFEDHRLLDDVAQSDVAQLDLDLRRRVDAERRRRRRGLGRGSFPRAGRRLDLRAIVVQFEPRLAPHELARIREVLAQIAHRAYGVFEDLARGPRGLGQRSEVDGADLLYLIVDVEQIDARRDDREHQHPGQQGET